MEKINDLNRFKTLQNIILKGFDPVSAGGFTQVPNIILNNKNLSFASKVVYSKLLSYAWHNNAVFPGQVRLAEEIGCKTTRINEALQELKTVGFLEIQRRGQGKTNIYILKHRVKTKKEK
jgi:hypothetical protein